MAAYSSISIRFTPDRWQYEGRSHSLWFCDAQEKGAFRWYETAFMINPLISRRARQDPFALDPGEGAAPAIHSGIAETQVAWPFTPIDQGLSDEFVERWIGWFADAAAGNLRHPQLMPERNVQGSWRSV